jgi:uncharacterized protein YbjQ (UPF0145 family)
MLLINVDSLPSEKILHYKGIVDHEIVIGVNLFRDIFASFRDVFGGETKSYQKELVKLKNLTKQGLIEKAKKIGANAIIGIKIDFEELSGQGKSMFMLSIQGTAVVVEKSLIDEQSEEVLYFEDALNKSIAIKIKKSILEEDKDVYDFVEVSKNFELITEFKLWDIQTLEKILEFYDANSLYKLPKDSLRDVFVSIDSAIIYEFIEDNIDKIGHGLMANIKLALALKSVYHSDFIIKMLSNEDYKIRYKSLVLAIPFMQHFSKESTHELKKVRLFLNDKFDKTIHTETVKKLLNEEIITECIRCNKARKMKNNSVQKCEYCGIDTLSGYNSISFKDVKHAVNLKEIKSSLDEMIDVLESTFKSFQ